MAQELIYHGLVSRHSTLAVDLEVMRRAGFHGLEISAAKMKHSTVISSFGGSSILKRTCAQLGT